MLKPGDAVPKLKLQDDEGLPFEFASLKGKRVVLFFYPRADTPGCTTEACEFRTAKEKFTVADAVIVGISPNTGKEQAKFKNKFNLPFTLVADHEHSAAAAFGVWGKKKFMGREYMGVNRTTFVIGTNGKIEHVFEKVKPEGHAEQVYSYLTS